MDKGLIYRAVKNKKITIFLSLVVVVFGLYSYYMVPKQETPDVSAPVAMATAVYPGASPEEVEQLVTRKIEDEAAELEGYDYSESYSQNGLSVVVVFLEVGSDTEDAWSELRRNLDDVQSELPEQCSDININTELSETAGVILSLSGQNYTYEQLASFAENYKEELSGIDGISRLEIDGKLDKEVRVSSQVEKLNQYEVSLEDILKILKGQNTEIPSGAVENEEAKINVKTPNAYNSLRDIEKTVIDVSPETGAAVRLEDVADVSWQLEDSVYKVKHNGENAVLLTAYFKKGRNAVLIGRDVQDKLEELKSGIPGDVNVDKVLFQPADIHNTVTDFTANLLTGVLLVIVVVCIGMGLRNAVVASTGIPLSILVTFIVMYLAGINVHQISVAALIIALGILVDNAIVVSDAVQVRLDRGEDKLGACVEGARETAVPIFTSTLTTITAFSPLLLVPGVAGDYLQSIPQLVIISLVSSFGVAMLVIPAVAYLFFGSGGKKEHRESPLRRFFNGLLELGLRRKIPTLLTAILVFGAAMYLTSFLGLQFFPKADKNIIYADINTETASDLSKTEELAGKVGKVLEKQEEITSYTTTIGDGLPKFFITMLTSIQSKDYAQVMMHVDLDKTGKFENNTELVEHLQNIFDSKIAGGTVEVKELEQAEPREAPVQLRLTGKDMGKLEKAAKDIKGLLSGIPGTAGIEDDASDKKYQFLVNVDSDRAMNMGISNYDIQRQINIALRGADASVFRKGGNEYDIVVDSNIKSKERLENLAIKSTVAGNKVLLKQVARVELDAQRPLIKRYDGERVVTVNSDVRPGHSPVEIENTLERKLHTLDLGSVDVVFDGEREDIKKNFGNLGKIALFALGLIYIILLMQFNSFVQPLIILLTVPLSLIGSGLGLLAFGQPMSFTSLLGVVSLMGLVVKNAILLIEYINYSREEGYMVHDACMQAMGRRFRPIILTAVTTISGLVPLAFSGSPLFVPMAVSLMSGLLVSTFLTLVIIPVVYSLIYGSTAFYKNRFIPGDGF